MMTTWAEFLRLIIFRTRVKNQSCNSNCDDAESISAKGMALHKNRKAHSSLFPFPTIPLENKKHPKA